MSREIEEFKGDGTHNPVTQYKIRGDYKERGLDICHYCGLNFNVGERIPRIVVGCGHTFCTSCLNHFLRNGRIRCPMCRKLLKGVDSVDKLPLNFNILYEVVTRDPLLSSVNFEKCLQADPDAYESEEAYERDCAIYMCQNHDQRIKHFYCSEHPSIFCRECIKDLHNLDACFVVDLYEIEKMRKLQQDNNKLNRLQLTRRQDGASESYIQPMSPPRHRNPLLNPSSDTAESRRPRHEPPQKAGYFQPQHYPVQSAATASAAANNATIVEFDANQFDGQGMSSQSKAQLMAIKHQQMLLNAGNKNFPSQQHFSYGQEEANSFSDGEDDDEENGEEENSDYENGELNSAQKQKLKNDLLMMGYGAENGGFENDGDDDDVHIEADLIAKAEKARLIMMQQEKQQFLLQQAQFQEAMRIQMAMKQIPIDGELMPDTMGLRQKNAPSDFEEFVVEDQPSNATDSVDDEVDQQRKFELDKQLFKQQMKEQLLGKAAAAPKTATKPPVEEIKAHATIEKDSADGDTNENDDDDSFNSQIEIGAAVLDPQVANGNADSFQTPPVNKVTNPGEKESLETIVTPGEVALESRKSLTELQQNNEVKGGGEEAAAQSETKENTAPVIAEKAAMAE